ncbi:hypothetical protein BSKO_03814 [Bryopsis sp. KO-2023]|nr:hypothetical protein BSKO_03814 [Bryopsis sp. KO-2023]
MADEEHHHKSLWYLRCRGLSVAVIILALCRCVAGHSLDDSVRITVEEQRSALLNLRQALGNPHRLVGWTGAGPCVDGQPVWFGITACSEDNLVQSVDLSVVTVGSSAPLFLGPSEVTDDPCTVQPPQPQANSTTAGPASQPSEGAPCREQVVSSDPTPSSSPVKPASVKEKKAKGGKLHIVATALSDIEENPIAHVHNETGLDPPEAIPPSAEQLGTGPCQENNKGNKQKTDPGTVDVLEHLENEASSAEIDSTENTTVLGGGNQSESGGQADVREEKGAKVDSGKDVDDPEKNAKKNMEKMSGEKESITNGNGDDRIVKNKEGKKGGKEVEKGEDRPRSNKNVASGEGLESRSPVHTPATDEVALMGQGPRTDNSSEFNDVRDMNFGKVVNEAPASTIDQAAGISQDALPEIAPAIGPGVLEETLGSDSFPVEGPMDIPEPALAPLESPSSEEEGKELFDIDSDASDSEFSPSMAPDSEETLPPWTDIDEQGTGGGPSISHTSTGGLAGESSLPELPPHTCVDNITTSRGGSSKRCDLCACLDDPASDICIREASITCVDGGENPLTCRTLDGAFLSLRVAEIQGAARIFQDRCEGLDNLTADFCSCTEDFESTECKAGWLQLCETNTEICALAFTAVSNFSQRQEFVNTLIDEGACEVNTRMVVFTLELGGISSSDFTPAVSERIRSITAAIAGADVSSVRVAAIGDVQFRSGQRRLLEERNGVEVIVLILAGSTTEAEIYNGRAEKARKNGHMEKKFSTAGFDLVSARVQDLDPTQSTTRVQEAATLGIPEDEIANTEASNALDWWEMLLIITGAIAGACICVFWMIVCAQRRLTAAENRSAPRSIPHCRESSRKPSQDIRSKPMNPSSSVDQSSAAGISRLRAVPQEEILPNPFPTPRSSRRGSHDRRTRSMDISPRLPPIQSSGLPSPSRIMPPRPPSHSSRLTADMDSDQTDYEALAVAHEKTIREAAALMNYWVTAFDNAPDASEADMYTETFSNMLFDASTGSSDRLRSPP